MVEGHRRCRWRFRRVAGALTAAALVVAGACSAAAQASPSLQMLEPGPTTLSTHNQREGAAPFTVAIDDKAATIAPGRHRFRGLAPGLRNLAVVCPAGGPWVLAQPDATGAFAVDVDVPDIRGPMAVEVFAWDSPPGDPNYRVNIDARFDLFVLGAVPPPSDPATAPGGPAAGLTRVWSDEFDAPLSISGSRHADARWFTGGKPSAGGSQYSDALFVGADDARDPFTLRDGFLRIRARPNPPDPRHPEPPWWSGHLSTGFPDESASVAFRTGYAEARMMLPPGRGPWPAFWLLDSASTLPSRSYGAVEIDAMEAYGHDLRWYMATEHEWPGPGGQPPHAFNEHKVNRDAKDLEGFHRYGVKLTDTEVIWFYDGAEVARAPLFRHDVVSPFFLMIDLAMGGGWPVAAPPGGSYDLWVDYVRVYR